MTVIRCDHCGTRYRVDPGRLAGRTGRVRCARCKKVFSLPPARPCLVVAKEGEAFHREVREALHGLSVELLFAEDGVTALELIQKRRPVLALLDVALPKIYGFELAEMIRNDPHISGTRIVLLAAVFDKTRYKRKPESLYGADDYIEAHHLGDHLLPKIRRLVPGLFTAAAAESSPEAVEERPPVGDDRARRLARIIVSDIALYNQEKVETGIREGDLAARLSAELAEGREMMARRFPDLAAEEREALLQEEIQTLMRHRRIASPVR